MAGFDISGVNSALFGTQSSSSSGSSGIAGLSSEYASIKNGSYKKLLNSYYAQENNASAKAELSDSQKMNLSSVRQKSDALEKSANALMDPTLFEPKTITHTDEETGEVTETVEYDREAIAKAVNAFVKDYNALLDELSESEDKNVLQKAVWMVRMTDSMQNTLKEAGISLDSNNKLSVNEDTLNGAGMNVLTTLFQGRNSFADKVLQKATGISDEAVRAASNDKTTYGKGGDLTDFYNAGLLYDETSE